MPGQDTPITTYVSLCRPGCEAWLQAELSEGGDPASGVRAALGGAPASGPGWVAWQLRRPGAEPPPGTLMFERQRLSGAAFLPGASVGEWAAALVSSIVPGLERRAGRCTLHCFAADPAGSRTAAGRAARLERRLLEAGGPDGRAPLLVPAASRPEVSEGSVLQVCVVEEGLWWALTALSRLVDPNPGGVHRMTRAGGAPSRSYLKLAEALDVLGRAPQARERVIDLGAAPGGWSYACLERGCRVLAVDNGPLRLPGLEALPGELSHLRSDGLRLRPPAGWLPADWMLSDMLIPPGVCLGLLRKWIEGGWMRRFVVNVKLPQREPLAALRPLQAYLAGVPGLAWRMRQLYHDRREVTVMGELPVSRPLRAAEPAPVRRAVKLGHSGHGGASPRHRSAPGAARRRAHGGRR